MCGLAGYFTHGLQPPEVSLRMMRALTNRGPDAQHRVLWNEQGQRTLEGSHSGLIHARLSIIDPRPEADQPMSSDQEDLWICYNGEVYGWQEHAAELRAQGAVFRTRSDTEFILHAWRHWGLDMLPKLRGMFAIAILDQRARKLWLIRDRLGIKPMLYAQGGWGFAFGSTVRSVLPALPPDQCQFDPEGLDAYLAHRYIPAPRTIFRGIRRLPNAHWLCHDLQSGQTQIQRYWNPPAAQEEKRVAPAEVLALLDEAVRLRTVADRPLGVFLSSGIDSSCVAARLCSQGLTGMKAFTAGFAESSMDESAEAGLIAAELGFEHRIIPIAPSIDAQIEAMVADLDEPFADPSAIPTWLLARETSRHIKVVLGGDGGDEMLAGYKRLSKHRQGSWRGSWQLPLPRRGACNDILGGRLSRLMDEASMSWQEAYSLRFSGFSPSQRRALQPDLTATERVYWRNFPANPELDPLRQMLEIDRENYLPEYILRKGDLCTMSQGLELRVPLLDHQLFSLISSLPSAQRFTQPPKLLFEGALERLKAMRLFEARKKGFSPPLENWLQFDLRHRIDDLPSQLEQVSVGQIRAAPVQQLVTSHRAGMKRHAESLLQLLMLQISLGQLRELLRA